MYKVIQNLIDTFVSHSKERERKKDEIWTLSDVEAIVPRFMNPAFGHKIREDRTKEKKHILKKWNCIWNGMLPRAV